MKERIRLAVAIIAGSAVLVVIVNMAMGWPADHNPFSLHPSLPSQAPAHTRYWWQGYTWGSSPQARQEVASYGGNGLTWGQNARGVCGQAVPGKAGGGGIPASDVGQWVAGCVDGLRS
jgi:hypothetical protein